MIKKSKGKCHTHVTMDIFSTKANSQKTALLPVGSVEAHGHHLPIDTDSIIATKIVEEVSCRTGILALPAITYSYIKGLKDFQGSVSLSPDTFKMVLYDIAIDLWQKGITKLVVVNCHIPNSPLIDEVSHKVSDKIKLLNMTFPGIDYVLKNICTSKQWQPGIFHAEEIETSLMLYLRPDLVNMSKARPSYPDRPKDFGIRYVVERFCP